MKTPDKNNPQGKKDVLTEQEKQELNYQKREEIRMARESGAGEATPPEMPSADHAKYYKKDDNNFDNVNISPEGKSLEDRDTNDGDANNENN
ncbi:MAG: hypothetical protein LPK19_01720 [Hymenobacteraceae bacterium]|nr:hypothetical protein [Hymenobacteraceae bacterium]MDX5394892.1 hypothetical protein [Hymenobacteraceae bacterium]MDX5510928.1 hypothetical protein [Hymenobacteraceae bacterium]